MSRFVEFALHNIALVSAFFGLLVAYFIVEGMRGARSVSPQGLTRLYNNDGAVLIDIRNSNEFKQGHITGSRNIPYAKLMEHLSELPADKPLVIICNIGQTAGAAARQLKAKGLQQVYKLDGGISGWKSSSLPLVKR